MLTKSSNSQAPGAIDEWNGTVQLERNGRKITGKKTETERDVPFLRTAVYGTETCTNDAYCMCVYMSVDTKL